VADNRRIDHIGEPLDYFWLLAMRIGLLIAYGVLFGGVFVRRLRITDDISSEGKSKHGFAFWITLIRGLLALTLGFALLFIPEKTHSMLYNFMGMFWLMSGLVLVRQEMHLKRHIIFRIIGLTGVLVGAIVLARFLIADWLGESLVINLLGAVVLLTGILHVIDGFQYGRKAMLGRTGLSTALGIFEVILGGIVLFSHTGTSQIVYILATIWALLAGSLLFVDAFRQRRQMKASS
jgi:uncharacterized membrane protein HdeD (DUF308 family)